ncbi:putative protein-serine/threonine phosphatase [Helianthus annuus]|nr:putative protein-serine/threonine phosphatase [Helianthus annuus]KAJ0730553.1 putative protein-serine/threonine phosphatase [Helianthus annuus]
MGEQRSYGLAFGIRWGSAKLQGAREEMEDDALIVANNDDLQGFYFAAVFDSHTGFSSINFLRLVFCTAHQLLEMTSEEDDESGAIATAIFIGNDMLYISHVLSQSGKAEELTNSQRPYGRNKVSLQEIKRIREARGWISDRRICGDISVSRAFGDIRFKTKKNERVWKANMVRIG